MIWKCPNCDTALTQTTSNTFVCANKHSFDKAKEGYLNLLLDNQKRSKSPGDNTEMIDARQRFLGAGNYDPLIAAIIPFLNNESSLIDLGCGEGYYLRQICNALPNISGYGIDIAKPGIRKAAKQDPDKTKTNYAVASTYRLPLMDKSFKTALSIFAPFDEVEVKRILQEQGLLIRIGPGASHHQEIKTALYNEFQAHTEAKPLEHFKLRQQQQVVFELELSGQVLTQDLIPMTPFHWQGSAEIKQELHQYSSLIVTCDFSIEIFEIL